MSGSEGVFTYPKRGDVTRAGGAMNGLMHGNGVYYFHENNSYYEGQFEGNLMQGHGRLSVVHASTEGLQ